jgi:hypothetical protein
MGKSMKRAGVRLHIGYSIPDHRTIMPWCEAEMHSFSYTNDQVLYNQFSPYFRCRVPWLPIITNLGSLSQIRLNEYHLKSISFNYNIFGIWKIFNNTRQGKYGLKCYISYIVGCSFIGGENRSKSPICHKSLTDLITYCRIEYTFAMWEIQTHNFSVNRH